MISQTLFSPIPEQDITSVKVNVPSFDPRESAAVLFGVLSEQATPAMMKKIRVRFYPRPIENPDLEAVLDNGEAMLKVWPNCPNCKQSATGRYWKGITGCTRCGWSAGGNNPRKSAL